MVIMLVSAVLLFIIGSIVLVMEVYSTRTAISEELRTLANTLSANSRSLKIGTVEHEHGACTCIGDCDAHPVGPIVGEHISLGLIRDREVINRKL